MGKATVFVSHVWKMTAKDFFEVCLAELDEDDFAWIDLYLHNQYQGPVSDIGDENSQYWINKFGDLVGGIGKVTAFMTDWENPVMLTRIWCLFELNAAIDMDVELKFVATAKEQLELSLNLNKKFGGLGAAVKRIDVRNCDAKRPHEVQDKAIFLGKLAGVEDDVNEKLRKRMQRWLCEAAETVIERTDPRRPPLDESAMRLEVAVTGDCWWRGSLCYRPLRRKTTCCARRKTICCATRIEHGGAKLTRLLERLPRMATLVEALGFLIVGSAFIPLAVWWNEEAASGLWGALAFGIFYFGGLVAGMGMQLIQHQQKRQLRQPSLYPQYLTRNCQGTLTLIVVFFFFLVLPFYEYGAHLNTSEGEMPEERETHEDRETSEGWHDVLLTFIAGMFVTAALLTPLHAASSTAGRRASLRTKAGWLRLWLGDVDVAVARLGEANAELQSEIGPSDVCNSWVVAAAYARALCEAGRAGEVDAVDVSCFGCRRRPVGVRAQLEATEKGTAICYATKIASSFLIFDSSIMDVLSPGGRCRWSTCQCEGILGDSCCCIPSQTLGGVRSADCWRQYGALLRAGVAAALRAPDTEVLSLLEGAAKGWLKNNKTQPGCWVPAGSRPAPGVHNLSESSLETEGQLPEWDEFLARMASGHLQQRWVAYRDTTVRLARDHVAMLGKRERTGGSVVIEPALESRGLPKQVDRFETVEAKHARLLASLLGHAAYSGGAAVATGASVSALGGFLHAALPRDWGMCQPAAAQQVQVVSTLECP